MLPDSITSPAGSSSLIIPSTPSASSALSISSGSSTPLGITQDQYQSILSRLDNLPTQDQMQSILSMISRLEKVSMPDQIQSLVSMIGRLEDTVMGLRDDVSRNSEWTERTIGIHERRHHRQASPYSPNTALTPSPQRRHHRLSGSVSPTASQHSIMSFAGTSSRQQEQEQSTKSSSRSSTKKDKKQPKTKSSIKSADETKSTFHTGRSDKGF
ncbi:hypothetical protein BGZ88_005224 [Linnemannia elongata]|nr:hypothetical protein BGZ88_005224 [Linnemannia elongata]